MSVLGKYQGKDLIATISFNRNFGYEENSLIYVYPYFLITKDGLERVDSDLFPTRGCFEARLYGGITVQNIIEEYGEVVTIRINSEPTTNIRGSNVYAFRFNPEFGKARSELWIEKFTGHNLYQIIEVNQTYSSIEKTHKINKVNEFIYTNQILIKDNYKIYGPFDFKRDLDNSKDLILSSLESHDYLVGEYSEYELDEKIIDIKDQSENICAQLIPKDKVQLPEQRIKYFDWISDEAIIDYFLDIIRTEYSYNQEMLGQFKDMISKLEKGSFINNMTQSRLGKVKSLARQVTVNQAIFHNDIKAIINDESLLKGMIKSLSLQQEQVAKACQDYEKYQELGKKEDSSDKKDNESFESLFSLESGVKILEDNKTKRNSPKDNKEISKTSLLRSQLNKIFNEDNKNTDFFAQLKNNNDGELLPVLNKDNSLLSYDKQVTNDDNWAGRLPLSGNHIPTSVISRAIERKLNSTGKEFFKFSELNQQKESLEIENKQLKEKLELVSSVEELKKEKQNLDISVGELNQKVNKLEQEIKENQSLKEKVESELESKLESKLAEFNDQANVAAKLLDNQIMEKIVRKVVGDNQYYPTNKTVFSNQDIDQSIINENEPKTNISVFDTSLLNKPISPREIIERVLGVIKTKAHRKVSFNDIANYLICLNQGFITTLAGEPGTGKTSLCILLAKALGLARNDNSRRLVEIAVERGWTSHKDFIGYYNPLTKSMEKSNVEAFNAFERMSEECGNENNPYDEMKVAPYIVLLDEANLSPIEHYWAIFLKNCDLSSSSQREISLGGNRVFHLPQHLRFLATVNFDHTTEELSPRYLDRSWVIYLDPDNSDQIFDDDELVLNVNNMVPYGSIAKAFGVKDSDTINSDVAAKWQTIQDIFAHKGAMPITPRNLKMVHNYCKVACRCMDLNGISNRLAPLDYALSQKILPSINGSGENYQALIEALFNECTEQLMPVSAKHLKRMQRIAKNNMGFYQFFAR